MVWWKFQCWLFLNSPFPYSVCSLHGKAPGAVYSNGLKSWMDCMVFSDWAAARCVFEILPTERAKVLFADNSSFHMLTNDLIEGLKNATQRLSIFWETFLSYSSLPVHSFLKRSRLLGVLDELPRELILSQKKSWLIEKRIPKRYRIWSKNSLLSRLIKRFRVSRWNEILMGRSLCVNL